MQNRAALVSSVLVIGVGVVAAGPVSGAAPEVPDSPCANLERGSTQFVACAREELRSAGRSMLAVGGKADESSMRAFRQRAEVFAQRMADAMGPNDDPRKVLAQALPAEATAPPQPGVFPDDVASEQVVIGTCAAQPGKVRYWNGTSHPAGLGFGRCTVAVGAIGVTTFLYRLSGSWYVDASGSAGTIGISAAGPAVAVSHNSCGSYFATAIASFGPAPGQQISPPTHSASTPISDWCN